MDKPVTVLVTYRPKKGRERKCFNILKRHWPALKKARLVTSIRSPVWRATDKRSRRGGLGLGLSLAKELIELHDGTIEARSGGAGCGAEITMRFPLAPEQPPLQTPPGTTTRTMARGRVLVVEDNRDAAEMLQEMLLLWDQEVEVAHDGREAIDKAQSFRPDVVLCDIGLPLIDGYDVARTLRSHPELSSTFLVAVTGYASPDDARKAADAGFDRHLGKPVAVEKCSRPLRMSRAYSTESVTPPSVNERPDP